MKPEREGKLFVKRLMVYKLRSGFLAFYRSEASIVAFTEFKDSYPAFVQPNVGGGRPRSVRGLAREPGFAKSILQILFVGQIECPCKIAGMPTTPSAQLQASISKKMTRKTWVLILFCVPWICVAVYYTPFLVSLGWHVMHGMSVNYRGLRVRVPMGWTADLTLTKDDFPTNPQGITLEKQPKTLAFEVAGPEMMYFNLLLPDTGRDSAQQVEEWKSLFSRAHPPSQFNIASRDDVSSGTECLEATPVSNNSAAALTCISVKNGWVAEYAGAKEHVPVFLDVAAGLKGKR